MTRKPKAPDTSVQSAQLQLQKEQLEKTEAELKASQEAKAIEATEKFTARRRKQRGRFSLIKTSELGVTTSTGT